MPAARDVVLRVPTTDLPEEYRGGINYGTQVHFTFRNDCCTSSTLRTEANLLALE